jgi:hypothetical protein
MSGSVKVLDAGGDLLLSGDDPAEVETVLREHVARGARVVTPLSQVGRKWVAALKPAADALDRSITLNLAELARAQARQAAPPPQEPASDDTCTVEKMGFKRLLTASTRDAVQAKAQAFIDYGAGIVGAIEEIDGQWVVVCDIGGGQGRGGG